MFSISRWQDPSTLLFTSAPLRRALAATSRPYRARIVLLTLLIIGGTLLPLAPPLLYRSVIDQLVHGSALEPVLPIAVAAGVLTVLGILLTYAYTTMASSLGRQIIADLQMQMYRRLASMPLEFFTTLKGGAASARLTTDVYTAEPLFSRALVGLVANVLMLVGALAVLIAVDVRLAVALLLVPLIFKFVEVNERQIRLLIRVPNELNTDIATGAESLLSTPGMTLARQSGQVTREINRFQRTVERLRRIAARLAELGTRITTGYNLTFGVATSVLFIGGAWLASIGQLSIGSLVLFLLYIRLVQIPITAIGGLRYEALGAARAFERVYEVITAEGTPVGKEPNAPVEQAEGTGIVVSVQRGDRPPRAALAFERVWFRYQTFANLAIPKPLALGRG
ncbi:MAG: hypothetical protein GEU73_11950 [Chloroflexi bacterium]|nr:hypothetical protein [Chloroflexota bacterium]